MLSTILIIDKRKELSTKYKKSLDGQDISVVIAKTLKDAMVLLQNLEPDMIIVSDSIEESLGNFCQKIRALTYNIRPVIIALSKSADFNDRIKVLENGADDFISEPVNIEEFKSRIKAHLRRDVESNLDNKTLLPNLKLVRRALKRTLTSDNSAVLFFSIENLENYKAVYTELAADKIVQTFIAIAKSALNELDFIGQYDDTKFVIITNKYNAEKLANFLTFAFDTVAPKFYSATDAKRGYMLLKGEKYAGMRVNFVSLLAGCIIDGFDHIPTVDILLEKLFAIKSLAKIPKGSNYIIERAQLTTENSVIENFNNRNVYIKEDDDSLRYLIRTALELHGYDVQEELRTDECMQPSIIIFDSKENLSELEILKELKKQPNFTNTKFIVTTTFHNKSEVLNSGADLYLPKPYEIADLIKWVEYFLR
ncbi:MAG: response regulator [Cyanobacteria bacterium SIG28]|nr:response regulator [Cyanobacteria bacterium SIG28]